MLKKYSVICSVVFYGPVYYLKAYNISAPRVITPSTAKRFLEFAIKQRSFNWFGNTISFEYEKKEKVLDNENDVLPEEIERIEEILATLPVEYKGKGPYSENDMSKILDYFGVEDDVSEK